MCDDDTSWRAIRSNVWSNETDDLLPAPNMPSNRRTSATYTQYVHADHYFEGTITYYRFTLLTPAVLCEMWRLAVNKRLRKTVYGFLRVRIGMTRENFVAYKFNAVFMQKTRVPGRNHLCPRHNKACCDRFIFLSKQLASTNRWNKDFENVLKFVVKSTLLFAVSFDKINLKTFKLKFLIFALLYT